MTGQIENEFENLSDVDFSGLTFRGPVRASRVDANDVHGVETEFNLEKEWPPERVGTTALWRGYIDRFRLNADGTLDHLGYSYPIGFADSGEEYTELWKRQDGLERVAGDFWLQFVCPSDFEIERDSVYVPFRDGTIVRDRTQWKFPSAKEREQRVRERIERWESEGI